MVEKIGTIQNPLTIIAIFAAIAEISGTIVLPFISVENQETYIWFLMVFPLLLVVLFFLTLNFNHKVLYAPSDFKNEDNFFKPFQTASSAERTEKLKEEVREIEGESVRKDKQALSVQSEQEQSGCTLITQRDIGPSYVWAEELVLNKISQELGQFVRRNVRFETPGHKFIFNGVVMSEEKVTAIEIMYILDARSIPKRFMDVFRSIFDVAERLPGLMRSCFELILAVVTDTVRVEHKDLVNNLSALIGVTPFPVQIRVFSLEELEMEFYPRY